MNETTGGNTGEVERRVAEWCEKHPDAGDDARTAARLRIMAELDVSDAAANGRQEAFDTAESLADFWQWYESASGAEREDYQLLNDFGRQTYSEPALTEWTVNDAGSAAVLRAWPRGIDDPGDRALTGPDRATLDQRMAEYQHAYRRWQQRQ